MSFLKLITIFLFSIQLYGHSNSLNFESFEDNPHIYERYENLDNDIIGQIMRMKDNELSIIKKIKEIKENIIGFSTKLSLFYENEKMIRIMLYFYNDKDIAKLYEFVFKKQKINSLKVLLKYRKYNYDDSLFKYKILLFNNKTSWSNKLLDDKYLYTTSLFMFSSLGYLVDKCNLKMIKLAMTNGYDSNSNLLDLSIIKKCNKVSFFLIEEGFKSNLLLHIMRNDFNAVKFSVDTKVLQNDINEVNKIEVFNHELETIKEFNNTPLDYANYIGNRLIICLLKKYGAKRACEVLRLKCEN